jgi:hypothetical protein
MSFANLPLNDALAAGEQFTDALQTAIAAAIGTEPELVEILSVRAIDAGAQRRRLQSGSGVSVDFRVRAESSDAYVLADKITALSDTRDTTALSNIVLAAATAANVSPSSISASVAEVQVRPPPITANRPAADAEAPSPVAGIVGGVVAAIAVVGGGAAAFMYLKHQKAKDLEAKNKALEAAKNKAVEAATATFVAENPLRQRRPSQTQIRQIIAADPSTLAPGTTVTVIVPLQSDDAYERSNIKRVTLAPQAV